ncbi:MAG TPA: hypothetical protein VFG39_02715, partial [Balneolaceae bacterium]|nr:hypothetical protein [Balneolaceae bacterium]
LLFIISCNPASNDEPIDPVITPGFYGLEAQSTSIDGEVVSTGRFGGGGYYAQRLQFIEENALQIEVTSDIPKQNGLAKATYQVQDSNISVNITSSTTSRYPAGTEVTFTDFKVVDDSFSRTFQSNGDSYIFTGPGLLLERQYADQEDLDDDGNTAEMVSRTRFYGYLGMKYDNGGL